MAHFAELDSSNRVIRVVVISNVEIAAGDGESEERGVSFLRSLYGHGNWRQASYNGNMRKNYPGPGFTYDESRDAFIPPCPYPSWSTLNESTCRWVPPTPRPNSDGMWSWDETAGIWVNLRP